MRAIWTGAIGFGLVNIPVKLYAASESSNLDLDMLDKNDLSNIRFKRVNEKTGKEVPYANIVKGYKLEDNYIVLEDADFEAVAPEKSKLLSIKQFVKLEDVDPAYYETPYFLEPQKNGEDAYRLLLQALLKTEMAGIGTFILRDKEILGLVRPYDGKILMVNRMRFPEEVRSYEELKLPPKKKAKDEELQMAEMLISQLATEFDPKKYENSYSADLLAIIEKKAKGQTYKPTEEKEEKTSTTDLMAMLKASLEGSKKQAG